MGRSNGDSDGSDPNGEREGSDLDSGDNGVREGCDPRGEHEGLERGDKGLTDGRSRERGENDGRASGDRLGASVL